MYYVRMRGKIMGPFPIEHLKALVERGQVAAFHELSSDGVTWTPADSVAELFSPTLDIMPEINNPNQRNVPEPRTPEIARHFPSWGWWATLPLVVLVLILISVIAVLSMARLNPEPRLTGDQVYPALLKSTVWIITSDLRGWGSGVLVHRGERLILTNYHVVRQGRQVYVLFPSYQNKAVITDPQYYFENAKKLGVVGTVVEKDAGHDLALVQLEKLPAGVESVSLARKSASPGENVHSIGASGVNPDNLEGTLWRYTSGQVRQVYQQDIKLEDFRLTSYVVETTAPVNKGDSGGPVVNDHLQLVALVSSRNDKAEVRSVSYSIDVRELRACLKKYLDSQGIDMEESAPLRPTQQEVDR